MVLVFETNQSSLYYKDSNLDEIFHQFGIKLWYLPQLKMASKKQASILSNQMQSPNEVFTPRSVSENSPPIKNSAKSALKISIQRKSEKQGRYISLRSSTPASFSDYSWDFVIFEDNYRNGAFAHDSSYQELLSSPQKKA